jgi:hypothetical protein
VMPTCGMAIVTRGMTYPGVPIHVPCEKPTVHAIVEVRPQIRMVAAPVAEGPAGAPSVIATSVLRPQIRSIRSPDISTGQDTPTVVSTDDLRPRIVDTEEE